MKLKITKIKKMRLKKIWNHQKKNVELLKTWCQALKNKIPMTCNLLNKEKLLLNQKIQLLILCRVNLKKRKLRFSQIIKRLRNWKWVWLRHKSILSERFLTIEVTHTIQPRQYPLIMLTNSTTEEINSSSYIIKQTVYNREKLYLSFWKQMMIEKVQIKDLHIEKMVETIQAAQLNSKKVTFQ